MYECECLYRLKSRLNFKTLWLGLSSLDWLMDQQMLLHALIDLLSYIIINSIQN